MSGGLPRYRTHTCGELRAQHTSTTARLSGWVHRKRDHGGLLFIDLRDNYGLTQCVLKGSSPHLRTAEGLRLESVLTVTGTVVARAPEAMNPKLPTGEIELAVEDLEPLSVAEPLPIQVSGDAEYPEETRLRHRFLDLRREKLHRNILLRSHVIASIRRRMIAAGFTEFQTPILTSSSPEGARDYLVPSRVHPGKFYALPQAPQQFKQLLMVAGRVLPARPRDVVRHPGGRVRGDRAGPPRRVRGIPSGVRGDTAAVPPDPVRRGRSEIRLRQAGPAQSALDPRRHGGLP